MKTKLLLVFLLLIIGKSYAITEKAGHFKGTLVYASEATSPLYKQNPIYMNYTHFFKKFSIYQFNTIQMTNYLNSSEERNSGGSISLSLSLVDKNWPLHLYVHDVRSQNYILQEHTATGIVIHPKTPTFTYRGFNGGSTEDRAVLTIRENFISGYIQENGEYYYLEPAGNFDKNAPTTDFVVYRLQDLLVSTPLSCTQNQANINNEPGGIFKHSLVTKCTEIAIAYDQSFKTLMGSIAKAEAELTSRLNLVSDHYELEFNIEYKIVTIFECSANLFISDNIVESCQEGNSTCAEGTVLREFRDWGNTPAGFGGVKKDVGTFWTNRNLCDGSNCGNIGYSFFAGICNDKGYEIVEDFYSTGVNAHASIWIHELGHTWNAIHVADNSTNMMSPSIYGNNSTAPTNRFVDSGTRSRINAHRDSRTCLTDGCTTVGIDKLSDAEKLIIYPNPADHFVMIPSDEVLEIELYSIAGQLVYKTKNTERSDNVSIDVSAYQNGIYLLKAVTSSQTKNFKLIVNH